MNPQEVQMNFCAVASTIARDSRTWGRTPSTGLPRRADLDPHIEKLNPGSPTAPRPAASVILLRRGGTHSSRGLEVLLAKRTSKARFMANVWVFPGGAVDSDAAKLPSDVAHR